MTRCNIGNAQISCPWIAVQSASGQDSTHTAKATENVHGVQAPVAPHENTADVQGRAFPNLRQATARGLQQTYTRRAPATARGLQQVQCMQPYESLKGEHLHDP